MGLKDGKRRVQKKQSHALNKDSALTRVKRFLSNSADERTRNKHNHYTYQPSDAVKIGGAILNFSVEDKAAIEEDVYSGLDAAISACDTLLANIATYHAAYGLEHFDAGETPEGKTSMPWPGASDLTMPVIFAELNSLHSYLVASAFVPRTVVVTGNNPDAAKDANAVENFYNAEMTRLRSDGKSWMQQFLVVAHLGLIEGTGVCDILVHETKTRTMIRTPKPLSSLAVKDGKKIENPGDDVQWNEKTVKEILVQPRYRKDFLPSPGDARTLAECVAVYYEDWYFEQQLLQMVGDTKKTGKGFLDEDAIAYVLNLEVDGSSDVGTTRQSDWDRTANHQISLGLAQGSQTSRFFRNRGPFKITRCLTNQYDFDEDGATEWNWVFLHEASPTYLGYMPFEYITQSIPTTIFTPLPRPNRIDGYSACEHLMELTGELSSITNDINNYLAQVINPTGLQDVDCIMEEEGEYLSSPGRVNLVKLPAGKSIQQVFSWFSPPPLPQEITQFASYLQTWISKVTGQNAPAVGAQSSGRRSATEQRQQSAATATRIGLSVLYYRFFLRESLNYIHKLYLQYDLIPEGGANVTSPNGSEMTVTREMLQKDYTINISGISDPNDQAAERNAIITLAGIALKNPDIMGNPVHRRNFFKVLFDKWQWPNSDDIVGTDAEAKQTAQAEAQAAQQQKLISAVTGKEPPKQGAPQ
jgi:hypothetical protein